MTKILATLLLATLFMACNSNPDPRADPICNCYDMFVKAVDAQKVDFDSGNTEEALMALYTSLSASDTDFKACTDNSIFDGDLFSRSKLRMFGGMDPDCVDGEKLLQIANNGPLIYKGM